MISVGTEINSHFMSHVSFYNPRKYHKTGGIERDKWYEMCYPNENTLWWTLMEINALDPISSSLPSLIYRHFFTYCFSFSQIF